MENRDRLADVQAVTRLILRGIFTWVMPADWGVDFGFDPRSQEQHRGYSSAEDILQAIGIGLPNEDDPAYNQWPSHEQKQYARSLWLEAGEKLRAMGSE